MSVHLVPSASTPTVADLLAEYQRQERRYEEACDRADKELEQPGLTDRWFAQSQHADRVRLEMQGAGQALHNATAKALGVEPRDLRATITALFEVMG